MQTKKVRDYIVNWLAQYSKKAGTKGFVVGVSGGIDSAVVSTLCAQTGISTLCVDLPIHQEKNQLTRAENHINWLKGNYKNVTNITADLSQTFEQFQAAMPHVQEPGNLALSLANTRARLRMTTLYYFAGLYGYLVVGTGNKVEDFGIGFFTKYGDGGVDISPIADLLKTEVHQLAKELGVSENILLAAPTDGLFGDSRTDEDQIGASYPELEQAMALAEKNTPHQELTERQKQVLEIYKKRHRVNRHKIDPIPVCEIPVHLK